MSDMSGDGPRASGEGIETPPKGDPKKEFPLEKILTMSAGDYCGLNNGRKLSDYTARGVHLSGNYGHNAERCFKEKIPTGTEVVVDYIAAVGDKWVAMSGTALIPKQRG